MSYTFEPAEVKCTAEEQAQSGVCCFYRALKELTMLQEVRVITVYPVVVTAPEQTQWERRLRSHSEDSGF